MAEKTFHSITLPGQDTARVPLTAAEFSTSVAYKVKDYCTYQGKLYRCTTAHAAGAWNAAHFTATDVDAEFDRKLDIPASQATAPANPRVGDLWIDNDENSPIYNVDASPTLNSTNAVQSGGTKVALNSLDSRKMEHGVITGDFSASVDYRVGDLVFYATTANGITTRTLYRCTTDHNSAAWNAAHFTATTLEVELQKIREHEVNTDMIGDLFGTKTTYAVGDYCIYNNNLYRCIQAVDNTGVATPAFDPDDWTQVALANDVSDLNSALNNMTDEFNDLTHQLSNKQDAPLIAGAAGQVLGLDDQLQPVWMNQSGGIFEVIKQALLQIARKTSYIDSGGATYYQDLYDALYPQQTMFSVINNLVGCDNNNSATLVAEGSLYTATIIPKVAYSLSGATVSVTMNGVDITTTVYNNGAIRIGRVTGDVIISITAEFSPTLWIAGLGTPGTSQSSPSYSPFYLTPANYTYDYTKKIVAIELSIARVGELSVGYTTDSTHIVGGQPYQAEYDTIHESFNVVDTGIQLIVFDEPLQLNEGECFFVGAQTDSATFYYNGTGERGFVSVVSNAYRVDTRSLGVNVYVA